ncbi:cytochrome oxidase maturation protein, cbb3-type [Pricia antarctica]|uniref:Cytochrome oxidase maturation protein, cbb3-type n=1 Tax=Pricia antarctica TaxID=641691 RepID=A0A1G7D5N7_9FLAO|nr:cbb3-type cytochrome oxidase assembly protein CcoS [Pricia antarctica]SDE46813.1 cytochrome oxidase maturation protein, cbb3-type [Pricia antarctica]
MSVIYVLLAISLIVALIFFVAFIVSVKSGQYDDSYTPSVRMLFDDELVKPTLRTGTDGKSQEKVQKNTLTHLKTNKNNPTE